MDKKRAYLFCKFLHTEMKTIDEAKWYYGEKIKRDPGQEYIVDWINRNAKEWREKWEASVCQHCISWMECGEKLKINCDNFVFDENENSKGDE